MSCTTEAFAPGGATLNASSESACAGGGSSSRAAEGGRAASNSSSRRQPCRADTKPFQLAMARSIGASARPDRIELAMMIPAVASCSITR